MKNKLCAYWSFDWKQQVFISKLHDIRQFFAALMWLLQAWTVLIVLHKPILFNFKMDLNGFSACNTFIADFSYNTILQNTLGLRCV